LKMFELLVTIMVSCPQRDAQSLKFHWHWMNGRCQDVLVEQSKIGEKLRNENVRLHRIPREDTLRTWLEHDWFLYYVLFFVLCISLRTIWLFCPYIECVANLVRTIISTSSKDRKPRSSLSNAAKASFTRSLPRLYHT
jgi:hypothetical protein